MDGVDLSKYATDVLKSGKISDKQYTITDWVGLVKEICKRIPDDEYPLSELVKFQNEILGYIEYKNDKLSNKMVAVTKLDLKYSPKFVAYSLKDGRLAELKIHKKKNPRDKKVKNAFLDTPVSDGDILLAKKWAKEPRRRKNADGEWENIPDSYDWWLNEYQIINTL